MSNNLPVEIAHESRAEQLRELVHRWRPHTKITSISALTPDASARRYYRISLEDAPRSVIAMVYLSVACPEASGSKQVNSDDAYVELTEFFRERSVPVPEILFDARKDKVLLLEDLGDLPLADAVGTLRGADGNRLKRTLYEQAIDIILKLQELPRESGRFFFERSFTRNLYQNEMQEFWDFVPFSKSDVAKAVVHRAFGEIADTVDNMPKVLVHRDFHSWNLMVQGTESITAIRPIDFQDALMGPACYDIVALLNDRDTDQLIGSTQYQELLSYFFDRRKAHALESQPTLRDYYFVLLQRDLKVAGRFHKLAARGAGGYLKWVPGTLRRIGTTLEHVKAIGEPNAALTDFQTLLADSKLLG
jgi:N-acetylmuramate 1-kinase